MIPPRDNNQSPCLLGCRCFYCDPASHFVSKREFNEALRFLKECTTDHQEFCLSCGGEVECNPGCELSAFLAKHGENK